MSNIAKVLSVCMSGRHAVLRRGAGAVRARRRARAGARQPAADGEPHTLNAHFFSEQK